MAQAGGGAVATFDDDAFADFIDADEASPPADAPFTATFDDDAFADFAAATPPPPGGNATNESSHEPPASSAGAEESATSPPAAAGSSAADDERREFELERQRRLQLLEEQKRQQSASESQSASSQWGGWLSSMPTLPGAAMDLTSLQKLASEQVSAASAALTSPSGVASGLADIRGKLQSSAELLQMQSPVSSFSNFSKNLEGLSMASTVPSLSAPSSMMANASSLMDMTKWGWGGGTSGSATDQGKEAPVADAGAGDDAAAGTPGADGGTTGADEAVAKPKR